jgi:hypothetical protein
MPKLLTAEKKTLSDAFFTPKQGIRTWTEAIADSKYCIYLLYENSREKERTGGADVTYSGTINKNAGNAVVSLILSNS